MSFDRLRVSAVLGYPVYYMRTYASYNPCGRHKDQILPKLAAQAIRRPPLNGPG